jgi:hypothetical protein
LLKPIDERLLDWLSLEKHENSGNYSPMMG